MTPFSSTFHDVHCTSCLHSSWLSKDKKRKEDCSSYLIIYSRQSLSGSRSVKTYLNKEYFFSKLHVSLCRFISFIENRNLSTLLHLQHNSHDFKVIHRKGANNVVPDALSRMHEDEVEAPIISAINITQQ